MAPPAEKSVHRFLPTENTFLHRVSPDHVRHALTANSTMPEFLEQLTDEFFNRFPYRNVRLAEHFEHTEEEDGECLYGRALWGFPEEKGKGKKVLPKPSGEIDVEETTAYWRKRLARQGYIQLGDTSPYARDLPFKELTDRLVGRLHLYPGVDYGAYTDEDRRRVLKDLPWDLDALARVISGHTGAEISILAGWRNEQNQLSVYSASSPLTEEWMTEAMEEEFAQFQFEKNCQLLPLYVRQAPPRVYGAFDGSYRPWFPSITPDCTCPRALLREYVGYYQVFQHNKPPVPWESGTEGPNDNSRLINPLRLPEGVTHLRDPNVLDDEQVWKLIFHIIAGQRGNLPQQQMFQLLGRRTIEEDTGLIPWLGNDHEMRYGPANRLYVARCIFRTEGDAQAHRELINMLPPYPTPETRYFPFQEADFNQLKKLCEHKTELSELLDALWAYDEVGPISPPGEFYCYATRDCPHFPDTRPPPTGFLGHLGGIWFLKAFYDKTELFYPRAGVQALSDFIRSDVFEHEPTGTLMSGPYAAKWLVLTVVRAQINWLQLSNKEAPPYRNPILPDLAKWHNTIDSDILYLTHRLVESRRIIMNLRTTCPREAEEYDMIPEFRNAEIHRPAAIVSALKQPESICDGSRVVYNRQPSRSSGFGHKSKGRVSIVLPRRTSGPRAASAMSVDPPNPQRGEMPESEDSPHRPVTVPRRVPKSLEESDEDVKPEILKGPRIFGTPGPSSQRFARYDDMDDTELPSPDDNDPDWTDVDRPVTTSPPSM
ncbi:hypothetical protein FS749_015597 [Ceratobasidium sp. UAMH 11750]|nr:hypothetical protein FS749_015597 [Ceratobasidium sp. UAMH 11750]